MFLLPNQQFFPLFVVVLVLWILTSIICMKNFLIHSFYQRTDGDVNCIPQTPVCGGDEEMVLTQSDVNTRCPYTGKDMVNPVTNKHCKHNYDRDGIYYYIKIKKNKAK